MNPFDSIVKGTGEAVYSMAHGILAPLFCVILIFEPSLAHSWCGHTEARLKYEEYKAQEAPGASSRLKADALARRAGASVHQRQLVEAQASQPLRIAYSYQLLGNTPQDVADYIQNRLMPAAEAVLKRLLRACFHMNHLMR